MERSETLVSRLQSIELHLLGRIGVEMEGDTPPILMALSILPNMKTMVIIAGGLEGAVRGKWVNGTCQITSYDSISLSVREPRRRVDLDWHLHALGADIQRRLLSRRRHALNT